MRSIDVNAHLGGQHGQQDDSILMILNRLRYTGFYQQRDRPWHVSLVFGSHLYQWVKLIELARERDPGLEFADFADAVRRLGRMADDRFVTLLPKGRDATWLRQHFKDWPHQAPDRAADRISSLAARPTGPPASDLHRYVVPQGAGPHSSWR